MLEGLDIAPLDSELLNRRYALIAAGDTEADVTPAGEWTAPDED